MVDDAVLEGLDAPFVAPLTLVCQDGHTSAVALVIGHYNKAAEPLIKCLPAIFVGLMDCWNFTSGASVAKRLTPDDLEYCARPKFRGVMDGVSTVLVELSMGCAAHRLVGLI